LKKNDTLHLSAELKRKTIHLGCSFLPLSYHFFFNKEQIVLISGIITIVFLAGEFYRINFKTGEALFRRIFHPLLRADEKKQQLTGATYLFLSATITFFFFKKIYAVPAVLILTISDSLAAVFGKMWGRYGFLKKTWQGSLTFFLSSFIILVLFTPLGMTKILLVVSIITMIEAISLPVKDNLVLSISAAVLLMLMNKL
jgi:dolichol kinase